MFSRKFFALKMFAARYFALGSSTPPTADTTGIKFFVGGYNQPSYMENPNPVFNQNVDNSPVFVDADGMITFLRAQAPAFFVRKPQ